jgi:ribonuclease P protein component
LRNQRDFQRLYREGVRYRGRLFTLLVRSAPDLDCLRAAVVAGKKVGGAVVRNRVKRRLRAILDTLLAAGARGADLVIIAHPPAVEAAYDDLAGAVGRALRRAGLLAE